jgi:pimeloyl-ACP methyl ester carboxylesterase
MLRILGGTLLLVALLVAASAGLRALERVLLFPAPPPPEQEPVLEAGVERSWLELPFGRVEAFLLAPDAPASGPRPLLVFAHGNGELVDHWLSGFSRLRALGVAVLLVEYPGYGRSAGMPSESSIQSALAAGYDWALGKGTLDPGRVIGHGRSLGGGAVCALGRVRSLSALVLESTFTSIGDVAAEWLRALRFVSGGGFDNLTFLRGYASPVLVVHGEQDELIPLSQARRLAAAARAAELQVWPCGHGCSGVDAAVAAFLEKQGLL